MLSLAVAPDVRSGLSTWLTGATAVTLRTMSLALSAEVEPCEGKLELDAARTGDNMACFLFRKMR
jgi:hypothetical protein